MRSWQASRRHVLGRSANSFQLGVKAVGSSSMWPKACGNPNQWPILGLIYSHIVILLVTKLFLRPDRKVFIISDLIVPFIYSTTRHSVFPCYHLMSVLVWPNFYTATIIGLLSLTDLRDKCWGLAKIVWDKSCYLNQSNQLFKSQYQMCSLTEFFKWGIGSTLWCGGVVCACLCVYDIN